MLGLVLFASLTAISYRFPTDRVITYDVVSTFDGFLPILGGQTGKAELDFSIAVQAVAADAAGMPRVQSELTAVKLVFNGDAIPLGLPDALKLFPKSVTTMTPQGVVLASDKPAKELPIRLPGLDVNRLPDATFLPIAFAAGGIEERVAWKFAKRLGDSDATYTVVPTKITNESVDMTLSATQRYEVFEDEAKAVVNDPDEAVSRVATDVTSTGSAEFDRTSGTMKRYTIEATSRSKAVDLKSGASTDRRLTFRIVVVRKT